MGWVWGRVNGGTYGGVDVGLLDLGGDRGGVDGLGELDLGDAGRDRGLEDRLGRLDLLDDGRRRRPGHLHRRAADDLGLGDGAQLREGGVDNWDRVSNRSAAEGRRRNVIGGSYSLRWSGTRAAPSW